MLFKWKESFSVGVEELDNQHKKLFEIGSRIYDIASLKDGFDHYDEIMQVVGELRDYTVYHFGFEENLMKSYGYSDLENHQVQHRFFVKRLERIINKDIDDQQETTMMEIVTFLADWVANHILQSDMQYKSLLSEK